MANEERLGPNVQRQPDRADEVQTLAEAPPARPPVGGEALFPGADITRLRNQWTEIQSGFVDEPESAVKRAGALVGEVLKNLSDTFTRERGKLESQWDRDG